MKCNGNVKYDITWIELKGSPEGYLNNIDAYGLGKCGKDTWNWAYMNV